MCPVFANAFLTSMISSPVISESLQLAVPPGIAYTPHEKFLLPFDDTTWVLLSLVFLFAFSVVFILMLVKSFSLNSFVLGDNVSTPGLNIYAVFMGIGMLKLPQRNIARILLMNYILFSLIMRTSYQGKYFEFLTTHPHKRSISSMDELIASKFPIYMEETSKKFKTDLYNFNFLDKQVLC